MSAEPRQVGDLILQILSTIYVKARARFQKEARKRGISVEQLAAAAITAALAERKRG
jgi:hypothetical protein